MRYLSWLLAVSLMLSPLPASVAWGREMPPQNAKPLSTIIQTVEQRPDFQAVKEIEFDDGVYEVEYYTKDGAKKEIKIDPASGEEK